MHFTRITDSIVTSASVEDSRRTLYNETKSPSQDPGGAPLLPRLRARFHRRSGRESLEKPEVEVEKPPPYPASPFEKDDTPRQCVPFLPRVPSSDVYDLDWHILPRGQPWRWCEGACRLRSNASLASRDVLQEWKEGSNRVTCKYCGVTGLDQGDGDAVTGRQRRQAMKYLVESHVLTPSGLLAWVCHICYHRDRWSGQAGPMKLEDMWAHWLRYHELSKHCGAS